ncbi:hypothetical protein [Roseococcus sp. YIM B11640]|uniref:hypothetical protein n=1 Tax=Roseococcus sp. YIM B11640 TaxID=3133973 RepID=UPI003C7C6E47
MLRRAYNFPSSAAGIAAIEAIPEGAAVDVQRIGPAFEPGEGGAQRPGWFCNIDWAAAEPVDWVEHRIPSEDAPNWWTGVPRVPATEEALGAYRQAINAHVQSVAQSRNYNGAATCASYVTDPNPAWAAEAQAFVAWRSAVYQHTFAALAAVQAGEMEPPAVEAFIASLPVIEWPA